MEEKRLHVNAGLLSFISSVVSVLMGLVLGYILLHVFNSPFANKGIVTLLTTGFTDSPKFAKVLYSATPILLTGLSVGFAFKTGLFNIGASGQLTIGAFFALVYAVIYQMPWYICLIVATIGGAIWGAIPGIFKAYFNVNEVITSIMFNWIAVFLVNLLINNLPYMISKAWGSINTDRTPELKFANPSAILPKLGLDEKYGWNYFNIGIFIAIIIAIIVWITLQKTTFGYELKACGLNKNASIYAGIDAKKNIVYSMLIAGALAGLGGGIYYLSGTTQYTVLKEVSAIGFNGIPVALLASSNPLGIIFSSLFISYIQVGGDSLQPEFAKEIIDIIIASIIYISAFSLLMRELIYKMIVKGVRR